jgi:hypothetical protein
VAAVVAKKVAEVVQVVLGPALDCLLLVELLIQSL